METRKTIDTVGAGGSATAAICREGQPIYAVSQIQDITERKQAEKALRVSEERFRCLIEGVPDAMVIVDETGRITMENSQMERLFGYEPGELLGCAIEQLVPAHGRKAHVVSREGFQASPRSRPMGVGATLSGLRKDGSEIPVEVSLFPIGTEEGRLTAASIRDVTQRSAVEGDLRRSRDLFEQAERIARVGSWSWDISTQAIHWSDETYRIFGVATREPISFEKYTEQIHPEDRELVASTVRASLSDLKPFSYHHRIVTGDGSVRVIHARGQVECGPDGAPVRMHGTGQDVTEQVRTEEALRASEQRFRGLVRDLRVGVVLQGPRAETLLANPAALELLGLDEDQIMGRTSYDQSWGVFREDSSPFPDAELPVAQAIASRKPVRNVVMGVYRPRTGDRVWLLVNAEPQLQLNGSVAQVVCTLHDVTEQRQAQRALRDERVLLARRVEARTSDLRAANAQLARASRHKDEFLASMSHELRTPLNAILGLSEALQEGVYGSLMEGQRKSLATIEQSGRHLLALINDILDLSKIEAGQLALEMGHVSVDLLVKSALQLIQELAHRKRLEVSATVDKSIGVIWADERRLKQILLNLLSNAVKFTHEGGRIGLEVTGDAAAGLVRFTVWDTGIGIATEDLGRLFTPFLQIDSRLAREYEGTGLGLALVRRMAELHDGGGVSVESEIERGSRFTVTLPWASGPAPTAHSRTTEEPALRCKTALVIEDSPTAADQITRYLGELGIEAVIHEGAKDAVASAVDLRPDVLILDLLLPDRSGWEILRELKADPRTATIPVVVASVVDDRAGSLELGAAEHLVKPITRGVLRSTLDEVLPGGVAPHPPGLVLRSPEAPAVRGRLLLAEDNAANAGTLTDYLESAGYRILPARNGREAVERALSQRPDLILMDIQMPGMDGLDAIRRIRAHEDTAAVPIVALTALVMPGDEERCRQAGANVYVTKPVSLRALAATVRELLAGREGL